MSDDTSINKGFYDAGTNSVSVAAKLRIHDGSCYIKANDMFYTEGIKIRYDSSWKTGGATITFDADSVVDNVTTADGTPWSRNGSSWSYQISADLIQRALSSGSHLDIAYLVTWSGGKHDPRIRVTPIP